MWRNLAEMVPQKQLEEVRGRSPQGYREGLGAASIKTGVESAYGFSA